MSNSAAIIDTRALTKVYGGSKRSKRALDQLTLSVQQGEIFGYLGPNGAGKTTTIKLLLDLIRPTSGSSTLFGMDARANSMDIRKRIGYLPGDLNLWAGQTGKQIIRYYARVRGMSSVPYADELAQRLEFDPSKKIRAYSTGNRRKLGLILALMHKPDLLILDEPTSGLDPLVQQTFVELMREAQTNGQTVFLSSHVLSEVQAICDRVAILREGQLQAVRDVGQLTHTDFRWITLRFDRPQPISLIADVSGVSNVEADGDTLKLRLTNDFDPLLRALNGVYVKDICVLEPTLEEIFLTFYGGNGQSTHNGTTTQANDEVKS
jgi:ABC-2 type transport system ATP-binding protein